jgi:hypothetical protein
MDQLELEADKYPNSTLFLCIERSWQTHIYRDTDFFFLKFKSGTESEWSGSEYSYRPDH